MPPKQPADNKTKLLKDRLAKLKARKKKIRQAAEARMNST